MKRGFGMPVAWVYSHYREVVDDHRRQVDEQRRILTALRDGNVAALRELQQHDSFRRANYEQTFGYFVWPEASVLFAIEADWLHVGTWLQVASTLSDAVVRALWAKHGYSAFRSILPSLSLTWCRMRKCDLVDDMCNFLRLVDLSSEHRTTDFSDDSVWCQHCVSRVISWPDSVVTKKDAYEFGYHSWRAQAPIIFDAIARKIEITEDMVLDWIVHATTEESRSFLSTLVPKIPHDSWVDRLCKIESPVHRDWALRLEALSREDGKLRYSELLKAKADQGKAGEAIPLALSLLEIVDTSSAPVKHMLEAPVFFVRADLLRMPSKSLFHFLMEKSADKKLEQQHFLSYPAEFIVSPENRPLLCYALSRQGDLPEIKEWIRDALFVPLMLGQVQEESPLQFLDSVTMRRIFVLAFKR
jgi:hypothetical protein